MKSKLVAALMVVTAALLMSSVPAGAVVPYSYITYTDPSGDVESLGLSDPIVQSIDIVSVTVDFASDPMVVSLETAGAIDLESSEVMVTYTVYLDQVGDGSESTTITVSFGMASLVSDYGAYFDFDLPLEGNGTTNLSIEVEHATIDLSAHSIYDVYAVASAADYPSAWAEDKVNEGFGVIPPDDDVDDDVDDDDDISDIDPLMETPTDLNVEVTVDSVDITVDEGEEMVEVEMSAEGGTSGPVVGVAMTNVIYFEDGNVSTSDWEFGPVEEPRTTIFGMTFEMRFIGTGPEGNEDWSSWEYYMFIRAPKDLWNEMMNDTDGMGDVENITKVIMVVRVYSDEDHTQWNQGHKDMTKEFLAFLKGEDTEEEDDEGLPAPGLVMMIVPAVLIVASAVLTSRRKRQ